MLKNIKEWNGENWMSNSHACYLSLTQVDLINPRMDKQLHPL